MKPRNYVVLAMIRANKQSAIHNKPFKSKRRSDNIKLHKGDPTDV